MKRLVQFFFSFAGAPVAAPPPAARAPRTRKRVSDRQRAYTVS